MLSRFAPNDIVPLRQLFIKSDSLLSFGYNMIRQAFFEFGIP